MILWLLVGVWPAAVYAHAAVERAEPEPNVVLAAHIHLVTVWFTEAVEPEFSEVRVLNIQGERVDNGDSLVSPDDPKAVSVTLPTLPDGTYTVAWKNVSTVDGHSLSGSYIYSVGQPLSGAAGPSGEVPLFNSPLEPVVRGLLLWGLLTVAGGLVFELLVIRPPRGDGDSEVESEVAEVLGSRLTAVLWVALIVAAVASAAQLLLQASALFGIPIAQIFGGPLRSALSRTDWGQMWVWRTWLMLLLIILLSVITVVRSTASEGRAVTILRVTQIAGLVNALAILLTLSLVSHAAASEEVRTAAIFSDFLHLLGAAFWVGGLVHFAFGLPLLLRLEKKERRAWLSGIVPRFSTMAVLCVGSLVITGLYSTWVQVTTPAALATPYGITLLAKVALLIPLIFLGAYNLLRVSPRLSKEDGAGQQLRRSVTAEAVIGILLLAAAGLLISLEPARQVATREGVGLAQELTYQETVEGTDISLMVEPALAGYNQAVISLADAQGDPISDAELVNLRFSYQGEELGTVEVAAGRGEKAGEYVANDVLLSVGGEWQAEVLVQRPDAFDAQTAFRLPLTASSGRSIEPDAKTGEILWGVELLLLGLLFMAMATYLRRQQAQQHRLVAAPGMAAVLAGLFLVANSQFGFIESGPKSNPFPPDEESIAEGQHVYDENCVSCHGPLGKGDGPLAETLTPPPADLAMHMMHFTDEYIFGIVQNGKPGTAMPAFGERLEEDSIWHLLNYLHTLPMEMPQATQ